VICGGESGPHLSDPRYRARWMQMAWARELRDACAAARVAFFQAGLGHAHGDATLARGGGRLALDLGKQ
jgi:protein gp37